MDNETTIDTVELDETSETSLAKELTNTVLTSAATTVGTLVGMVAIVSSDGQIIRTFRTRRAEKKALATTETNPTEV